MQSALMPGPFVDRLATLELTSSRSSEKPRKRPRHKKGRQLQVEKSNKLIELPMDLVFEVGINFSPPCSVSAELYLRSASNSTLLIFSGFLVCQNCFVPYICLDKPRPFGGRH